MARPKIVNTENQEAQKEEVAIPKKKTKADTFFNVKDVHIEWIKLLFEKGYDKVIIHGDGSMFAGKLGQKFNGLTMEDGSNHHKEFNSGVSAINENEIVSRIAFRAIYTRDGKLPETANDVIEEFYRNEKLELQAANRPEVKSVFTNTVSI